MQNLTIKKRLLVAISICFMISATAAAQTLLVGQVKSIGDFELDAASKQDVVGGVIRYGDKSLSIRKLSVHSLIGASEVVEGEATVTEHAVFSSSFNELTAVGQPWVAARKYSGCDEAYNSFLAVYRITDEKKVKALGPIPYKLLTESLESSDHSTVYCFISKPPEKV